MLPRMHMDLRGISMEIGLENGIVKVQTYNPNWDHLFQKEKNLLVIKLNGLHVDVQHIGSTAVPELSAKPIIDIMVGIINLNSSIEYIKYLEELGYEYKGENGITERHFFVKGTSEVTTHHLHMVEKCSEFWKRHLLFRDYLRKNGEVLIRYSNLKRELANRFPTDRDSYTEGKSGLISLIISAAEKDLKK